MLAAYKIDGTGINCWVNARCLNEKKRSLLFIHGAGVDHTVWMNQYEPMQDGYNIAAIDLPGHGHSEGKGEEDVFLYTTWVKKIIDCLGMNKPVLIGHSLGAAIGLVFAVKYGDALSGVVSVGGGVRMPVNEMILAGLKTDPAAVMGLVAKLCISKKHRGSLSDAMSSVFTRMKPDILHGDFLACDRLDITGEITQIKAPALVVCGDDDKMTPPAMSHFLADNIEGGRLAMIAGAGHMVMLEDPGAFNEVLEAFVESLPDVN
jgi:pimeloyl-ACP methyl ester carboxylesterase